MPAEFLALAAALFSGLLLVVGLLVVFRQGGPARTLSRDQAVRVLEDAIAGRLREAEWLVFMAMPVRADPVLLEVRLRCIDIEQRWFVGAGTHRAPSLFKREGLAEIERLLRWLRKEVDARLL